MLPINPSGAEFIVYDGTAGEQLHVYLNVQVRLQEILFSAVLSCSQRTTRSLKGKQTQAVQQQKNAEVCTLLVKTDFQMRHGEHFS